MTCQSQVTNSDCTPWPNLGQVCTWHCQFHSLFTSAKTQVSIGESRSDQSLKNRPNCLTSTRFRPEPKLQLAGGGYLIPRTDASGLSGGFASPKPKTQETRTRLALYAKFVDFGEKNAVFDIAL